MRDACDVPELSNPIAHALRAATALAGVSQTTRRDSREHFDGTWRLRDASTSTARRGVESLRRADCRAPGAYGERYTARPHGRLRLSCPHASRVVSGRPARPDRPCPSRDERKSRNGYAIDLKSNPRVICKTHRETDIITHETGAVELSLWPCAVSHARDRLLPVRFCLEIAKRG